MEIIVRSFDKDQDENFIYSTMPRNIYFSSHFTIHMELDEFLKQAYEYVKDLIQHASIIVASPTNEPTLIVGYLITHNSNLEFIYVKRAYRRSKIANLMFETIKPLSYNPKTLTRMGNHILETHEGLLKKNE